MPLPTANESTAAAQAAYASRVQSAAAEAESGIRAAAARGEFEFVLPRQHIRGTDIAALVSQLRAAGYEVNQRQNGKMSVRWGEAIGRTDRHMSRPGGVTP